MSFFLLVNEFEKENKKNKLKYYLFMSSNNKVQEFFNKYKSQNHRKITYDGVYEEMYKKFIEFDDIFLFHSTGTGKTLSSIILAYVYANKELEENNKRKIIIRVYTEKNVIPQFKAELNKFKQQFISKDSVLDENIFFDTFNTYNTLKKDLYFDERKGDIIRKNEENFKIDNMSREPPLIFLNKESDESTKFNKIKKDNKIYDLDKLFIRKNDKTKTYYFLGNFYMLINIYDEYPNIGNKNNFRYQASNQQILDIYKTYRNLNNDDNKFIQKNIFLSATPIKNNISDLSRLSSLYTLSTIQRISQKSEFKFDIKNSDKQINEQIESTRKSVFNFKINANWFDKNRLSKEYELDMKPENFPYNVFTQDLYEQISSRKDIIKELNSDYSKINKIKGYSKKSYIIDQRESACPQEFFFTFHRRTLNETSDDFPTAYDDKGIIEDVIIKKETDQNLIDETAYKYLIFYMNLPKKNRKNTNNIQQLINQKYNAFLGGDIKYSNMLKDGNKFKKIATVWDKIVEQIGYEFNDKVSNKIKKRYANKFLIHILYPHAEDNLNKNKMFNELSNKKYLPEQFQISNKELTIIVDRINYDNVKSSTFIDDCKNLYHDDVAIETRIDSYNIITGTNNKLTQDEYLQKIKSNNIIKRYLLIDVYCQKKDSKEDLINHMKNIYNSKYFNVICIIGPMVSVGNEFYCTDILFQTNLFFIPANEDQLHGRVIRKKSHHNCYVEGSEYNKQFKKDFVKIIRIIVHEKESDEESSNITLENYLSNLTDSTEKQKIIDLIQKLNKHVETTKS